MSTYFDMDAFETKHYLVNMVEVEAGTAEAIHSSVKNTFTELLIPMENIIGYSSDTTNVMFGEYWQYFILIANEDPTYTIERIHKSLQNKFTLAYLEFLSYQLERFNDFNLLFQCEKPVLHSLKPQVEMLLRSIASDFMKRDYVKATNPKKISPRCEEFHVPLENVYLGMAATATLREIAGGGAKEEDVSAFRSHCRNFLVESIDQIQKRFDLDAEIHDIVQCTLPQNAASMIPPSLEGICQKLPYLREILTLKKH